MFLLYDRVIGKRERARELVTDLIIICKSRGPKIADISHIDTTISDRCLIHGTVFCSKWAADCRLMIIGY